MRCRRVGGFAGGGFGLGLLLRGRRRCLVRRESLSLRRLSGVGRLLRGHLLGVVLSVSVGLSGVVGCSLGVRLLLRRHGLSLVSGRSLRLGRVRRLCLLL